MSGERTAIGMSEGYRIFRTDGSFGQKQAPFSKRSAIGADVPGKHLRYSRLRRSQAAIYRHQLSTASASSGTPKSTGTPVSSTSEWVRKDSDVALRAGLVGCARTGCAVSPLTGSIPDAREPRANAPLRVERGGRGPAGRSGKTSGNEIDGTASSSDATATSSAKSSLLRARAARAASPCADAYSGRRRAARRKPCGYSFRHSRSTR